MVSPKKSGKMKAQCSCSVAPAENKIRDIINLIKVYKSEEIQDVTTKIDPETAEELVAKLKELVKVVSQTCVCK